MRARPVRARPLSHPTGVTASSAPDDYIDSVFGPDGVLARAKPGYRPRASQVKLSRGVAEAFAERETLLAEAPTGTGKSFAYLVPAVYEAVHNSRRVVVVTANIALQEQLTESDLPFLREHLPWKFSFALAKGWNNYLCLDVFESARNDRLRRKLPLFGQAAEHFDQVVEWADRTQEGDVSELPFELGELKQHVTVGKEDCLGKQCDHYEHCYARKARERLKSTQVVVANYHLFFADMANGGRVLPDYQLVVMDEGHKAADIARDFFGQRITPGAVVRAVSMLDAKGRRAEKLSIPARIDPELKQQVSEQADRLFAELTDIKRSKDYKARLDRQGLFDPSELVASLRSAAGEYRRAMGSGGVSPEGRIHLEQQSDRCDVLASTLERAASNADADDWVYYLEETGFRGNVALMAVPFSVADVLRPRLFEREDNPLGVVVTSATLATSPKPEGFDFAKDQLGAEAASTLVVDSPFDYSRTCLVVPRVDAPNDRGEKANWLGQVVEQFLEASQLAGGRMLALFTSYKVLAACHEAIAQTRPPFAVFRQGSAPRTQLLERFREDETSVLLGTESFWEGVDVPGPSLSVLFMDRIPFDHFLDPIVDAVQARDSKAFFNDMVPRATIMFRQGFGRLVRSVTDQGVVVCCDPRLVDKPYGRGFIRALPKDLQVFRQLERAESFLPETVRAPF